MGADAFKNCTGLKCFDTGNGITVINSSTFWGNTGMTNFTIGENVTTISSYAFYGCENITSITIPDNVTRIKADAFRMCTGLKEIYFDGSAPTFDAYIFGGVTATAYYWPDETWTEDVRKNYGGTITWMERKIPVAVTFKDESGNVISQATYVEGAELVAPTVDEIANGRFEAYIFEGWGTDYTGICQGEAEYTAIGTGYTDLQEALDQDTAENITLVKDVECKYLTVQNGSVLDLNGHTLTTKYFTSFGQVVDGQIGGDAVLKAEKGIHLATANSFLPIYDSTAGGYRFYKYELQNLGFKTVAGDDNILKTGTRLNLANTAGYDVLAATENGALDTVVYLSWGDMPGPMRYTFRPETLRNYASQVAADIAAKGSSSKAITLTLTGLNGLDAGTQLNLQPAVETASGMQGQAENKSWTCG